MLLLRRNGSIVAAQTQTAVGEGCPGAAKRLRTWLPARRWRRQDCRGALSISSHDRISGIGKLKRSRLLLLARNVAFPRPCQTRSTTSTCDLSFITRTDFPIAFTR